MNVNIQPYLNFLKFYTFLDNPILLGGMAMQYYNLRESGHDLDIMISIFFITLSKSK